MAGLGAAVAREAVAERQDRGIAGIPSLEVPVRHDVEQGLERRGGILDGAVLEVCQRDPALGLALGALRRPDAPAGSPLSPTDKAVLLGSVLAAELPDLDTLLPAANSVDHALRVADSERQAFTPMLAILSAQHETQYSRLFRS